MFLYVNMLNDRNLCVPIVLVKVKFRPVYARGTIIETTVTERPGWLRTDAAGCAFFENVHRESSGEQAQLYFP